MLMFSSPFPFHSVGMPALGVTPVAFKVVLSPSVNPSWNSVSRNIQRCAPAVLELLVQSNGQSELIVSRVEGDTK